MEKILYIEIASNDNGGSFSVVAPEDRFDKDLIYDEIAVHFEVEEEPIFDTSAFLSGGEVHVTEHEVGSNFKVLDVNHFQSTYNSQICYDEELVNQLISEVHRVMERK